MNLRGWRLTLVAVLLQVFTSLASASLILKGETLRNADFWYMPNNYSVTAPLALAKYSLDGSCAIAGEPSSLEGKVLFLPLKPFTDAGCKNYGEAVAAIMELKPEVSIFETDFKTDDFGSLFENYGALRDYENSGLALTLIQSTSIVKLLAAWEESDGNLTVTVSADVGNWVRFADSPQFKAYRWFFLICFSVLFVGSILLTVMYIWNQGFQLSRPLVILVTLNLAYLVKVLDFSLDVLYLPHVLPYWARGLLFWTFYPLGYIAFILIGLVWLRGKRQLELFGEKVVLGFEIFFYISCGQLVLVAILGVVIRAFMESEEVQLAYIVNYYLFLPSFLGLTLILGSSGMVQSWTVYKAKKSSQTTFWTVLRQSKSTIWLFAGILGLWVLLGCSVSLSRNDISINDTIVALWIVELSCIWLALDFSFFLFPATGMRKKTLAMSPSVMMEPRPK